MGADHPIAWCQAIDGGRSWYTAMGHTTESFVEPLYRLHLLGGIESAAGIAGGCPR
jgi:type 1 glutamine amidotransferase